MHEKRIYKLFESMKQAASTTSGPSLMETTSYLRRHFQVPVTSHGYLYVLISSRNTDCKTFYLSETELSLSDELRRFNSRDFVHNSYIYENQPWAVGFFSGIFNTI